MRRALGIAAVNGALIVAVVAAAESIFGSWVWGPDYSVLNIPRNTVRHFDVSELYPRDRPITYTRDRHGLRGLYKFDGDRVMVRVAAGGRESTDETYRTLQAFNRTTLRVCRELGLLCVDLAGGITFEDGDFYDQMHTTPAGSGRIGHFLYERLKDRLR